MLQHKDASQTESNLTKSRPKEDAVLLLDAIRSPAILLSSDGTAKWMNTLACELTGWQEITFGRLPVFIALDLRTPNTHQDIPYERQDDGIAKLDPELAKHLLITDKSGVTHHVSCQCLGLGSNNSDLRDSLLILCDISSHFAITPNTDAYQFQLEKLVEASNVATWSMDIDSGEVKVNNRWFTMLGYNPDELKPVNMKLWRELVHPDDHIESIRNLDLHFQGAIPRYEDDIRMRHKDGHWVWIHAVGKVNEWHDDGTPKVLLGSHQDITERKLGEQRLKDSETHLRKLLDNLFVFVAVLSPDGRVQWANKSPLKAANLNLEDIVGEYFWEAPWFTKNSAVTDQLENACIEARNGKQSRFDLEHVRPSGQNAVEDFMISPLFDDQGNVTHLIPTAADISDRHRLMQRAEDAKYLLESVIENIPAMVFVKDAKELRYTHLNGTGEKMLNRKREDLIGKNTSDFFSPEQAVDFERHDRMALELSHGTEALNHPVTRGDGTPGFYRTSKVAMRDSNSNATHLVGISLDVTPLVESEVALKDLNKDLESRVAARTKELASSEAKFRLAMHESTIGMGLISPEGMWRDANKCVVEMFGYTREELLKIDFQTITHPDDLETDMGYVQRLLSGESTSLEYDKRFIHKDGYVVWAQVNVAVARGENGDGAYFVTQFQDITRDKLRSAVTDAIAHEFVNLEFDDYCKRVVEKLCELFQVDSAFISELNEGSSTSLYTRALILDGKHFSAVNYEKIASSLNDLNPGQQPNFVNSDFKKLYSKSTFVRDYDIQGYAEVPMYNSSGRLVGYIGMMNRMPIEENDGMSEALNQFAVAVGTTLERERSQKRYYDLVAFAPDGMLMLDLDGSIKFANRAAEQQLECKNTELLGQKFPDLVALAERPRIRDFLHSVGVTAAEDTATIRTTGVRSDGVIYPVELRANATGDEQGQVICVTLSDLSSRYEAEREMRQALAMLEATDDAAFILDPDTLKFTYVNNATIEQIGYSNEELVEKMGPADIIPKMTEKKLRSDLSKLYSNGSRADFKTAHLHRNGTIIPVQTTIRFIELPNDQTCFVALSKDITERIQQKEDRAARLEAEESNAAKSAFLAAMSHEIRTPMNGVIGSVDLLARSSLMAQQVDLVDTISDSANGLLRVIDDILDFSKIDAGKLTLESEPVSLRHEVESACAALAPVAVQKNVELLLYTAPDLPAWILSDSVRIRQILNNLVSNAIKFSSKQTSRGIVKVSIKRNSDNSVQMVVEDDGIGMEPAALDKLFQPFAQAESSTTRRFGGTGLGLSICRRLVELLEGSIEVTSTFGSGTNFTVMLPFEEDLVTSRPPENPSLEGISCIVVASSNLAGLDIWSQYLCYAGAKIEVCSDLVAARKMVEAGTANSIIMSEVDEDTARAWRQSFPTNNRPGVTLLQNGQRRLPREITTGVTSIDQTAMTLRNFLVSVAIAAGKQGYDVELEPRAVEDKRKSIDRADAIDMGQLILIAEDNEVNQKVVRRQLDLLGYAADVKDNGREALYAWKTGEYGLVLTDLHMPEMDGYELAESIRGFEEAGQRIPIIALTANALKDEKKRCIDRGMDDYLTKPISLDKLESSLRQWLPKQPEHSKTNDEGGANLGATISNDSDGLVTLDTAVLVSLIGDDEELVAEFLSEYRISLEEGAAKIRKAIEESDFDTLSAAAHKLKSSSRSVGALEIGEYCAILEDVDAAASRNLPKMLDTFNSLLHKVINSLDKSTGEANVLKA